MNTTQNTQKVIIAAAIIAASAGLALSSCAGQRQLPEAEQISKAQIAEQRAAYLDLAERRSEMSNDVAQARAGLYLDQAERRTGVGGPATGDAYRDVAERRADLGAPVAGDSYRDLAERRLRITGH